MTESRPRRRGWLLGVLLAAPFMAQADATIANVATPSIRTDLGASDATLELVIGAYLIAFAVLLIIGARLGQTHGYRRIFLIGVSVFTLASLLCGLAIDPVMLVIARVLQGVGSALMFPQTLTGIHLNFDGAKRKHAIGLYAMALSFGAVVGQSLGGALISADIGGSEWRAIFLINVPVGMAIIPVGLRHLPSDAARIARRVDLAGVGMLSVSMLLLVLPLVLGRTAGWPAWTWASLVASVPAFVLFLSIERRVTGRGGSPLINLGMIKLPAVSMALLTLLLATGTYYALLFTLAQYLQQGRGDSPFESGLTLVPWVAAFGLAGQLVRHLPARMLSIAPAAGCVLLAAAYAAISTVQFSNRSEVLLAALLGIGGLGLGIQFSALISHLTVVVPARYAPDISGVSTTTLQIGGAVGVAAFGTLFLSLASPSVTADASHAFAVTSGAFAVVALLAAATAYLSTRRHHAIGETNDRSVNF